MDNLASILQELKDAIHESEYTTALKPMGQELFNSVKTHIQSILYRSGYNEDDINVVVDADKEDSNVVKITLEDKSTRGREFLEYILNQS